MIKKQTKSPTLNKKTNESKRMNVKNCNRIMMEYGIFQKSLSLSLSLSLCLSICVSLSVSVAVAVSVCLCLSVSLCLCVCVSLSVCRHVQYRSKQNKQVQLKKEKVSNLLGSYSTWCSSHDRCRPAVRSLTMISVVVCNFRGDWWWGNKLPIAQELIFRFKGMK